MKPRRMTAADYVEAGIAPPPEYAEEHPRCDECGDEQGECACHER